MGATSLECVARPGAGAMAGMRPRITAGAAGVAAFIGAYSHRGDRQHHARRHAAVCPVLRTRGRGWACVAVETLQWLCVAAAAVGVAARRPAPLADVAAATLKSGYVGTLPDWDRLHAAQGMNAGSHGHRARMYQTRMGVTRMTRHQGARNAIQTPAGRRRGVAGPRRASQPPTGWSRSMAGRTS